MRLQLGASINIAFEEDEDEGSSVGGVGGFDLVFKAIRQFHAPFLRNLDLSRNRFFFYKHFNDKKFKAKVTMDAKQAKKMLQQQDDDHDDDENLSTTTIKLSREEKKQELDIVKKNFQEKRTNEIKIFFDTIVACQNLVILNLSHNVNLRSDGAVAVCEAATRLPSLKALLMERCSIDDRGAMEIARFFAQGRFACYYYSFRSSINNN